MKGGAEAVEHVEANLPSRSLEGRAYGAPVPTEDLPQVHAEMREGFELGNDDNDHGFAGYLRTSRMRWCP